MDSNKEAMKPLMLRVPVHLKARVKAQCVRLNISANALTTMALVKFLEEEETIENKHMKP